MYTFNLVKKLGLILPITAIALLFSGCLSTPDMVIYNNREVRTVGVVALNCKNPFTLDQDCSGFSGAKRLIEFNGEKVKIAGSSDGTIVMIMNNNSMGINTAKITSTAKAIEKHFTAKGAIVLDTVASAANRDIAAILLVFDQDVYTELKSYSIE